MFARGYVAVTLKRECLAVVGDADMTALDYDRSALARGMGEFSIPTALSGNLRFEVLNGDGSTSPEQLMAIAPNGLCGCIPVQGRGAPTPVRDAAADLPGKNCVMRLIQEVGLAPEQLLGTFACCDVLNYTDKIVD